MDFLDLIKKVDTQNVCMLCKTCKHFHEGKDRGLKDNMNHDVCSKFSCCGPIWGGSFDHYDGPMKGYLWKWCYLCGKESDKALKATKPNASPVGVCDHCLENHVKKYSARVTKNGYSVLVYQIEDDDNYEVSS